MNNRLYPYLVALFALAVVNSAGNAAALYDSIQFDNRYRTFLLHVPEGTTAGSTSPLVIALHGGVGNGVTFQSISGWSEKADAEKFIVAYPEGVKGGALDVRTWNAGWCCGFASASSVDDVGFINALIDTLKKRYPVDTTRIYATGMSNGGFLAYRLACELSHRIAAIAPVAASMTLDSCLPSRPVPIIHFHSYRDSAIPPAGGVGSGLSGHYNPSLDSVLAAWASLDACTSARETVSSNEQYDSFRWTTCGCGAEIRCYLTRDGGHSWPGGKATTIGDSSSVYLDGTDSIWSFFSAHRLACGETGNVDGGGHGGKRIKRREAIQQQKSNAAVTLYSLTGRKIAHLSGGGDAGSHRLTGGVYFIAGKAGVRAVVRAIRVLDR